MALGQVSDPIGVFTFQVIWPITPLVILWAFFVYMKQPLKGLGVSKGTLSDCIFVGMKYVFPFILVHYSIVLLMPDHWIEAIFQKINDPRISSVYERYGLEWAIFAISPTFWADGLYSIVEEIAYRLFRRITCGVGPF